MAYKFFQGTFKTDGILDVNNAVTGNSLLVDTGGITVSAGASSVQQLTASAFKVDNTVLDGDILSGLVQLTASAMSASSAQFGSVTVATLSAPNLDLSGYLIVSGNTTLGTDNADIVTVKGQLTASQGLSSSLGIQAGGGGTFAGNLVVNGATTTVQTLTASQGISASIGIQAGGNSIVNALNVNGAFNTYGTSVMAGVTVKAGDLVVQDGSAVEKARISNTAGNISGSGTLQAGGAGTVGGLLTANAGIKNFGTDLRSINQKIVVRDGGDANDKALLDGTGQVSGSGALNIGGAATVGNGLTVNGGVVSTINNRLNLGADGGTVSVSGSGQAQFGGAGTFNGLTINGAATFNQSAVFNQDVTIKNLYVTGTMTAVQSQDLAIKDAKVIIASGTVGTGSFDALDPAGIYVGGNTLDGSDAFGRISLNHNAGAWSWQVYASGAIDPTLQIGGGNAGAVSIGSTQVLTQTQLFQGAVTGSSAGVGLKLDVLTVSSSPVTLAYNNYVVSVDTSGARTINLPAATSGDVGRVFLIKDTKGQGATNNITITPNGTDKIDGVNASVVLNSDYAAVSIVCVAAANWALF